MHGRTREQRYSKPADWNYIKYCAREAASKSPHLQVVGNGDVFSWQDHVNALQSEDGEPSDVVTTYVARGALVKPWIFTEIKQKRDWDISAPERLDIVKKFVKNGLEHWGSDSRGVESCRRFLLEWLSFTHRYVPSGLLEVLPQKSNWRPASFVGRSDLETLLGSRGAVRPTPERRSAFAACTMPIDGFVNGSHTTLVPLRSEHPVMLGFARPKRNSTKFV